MNLEGIGKILSSNEPINAIKGFAGSDYGRRTMMGMGIGATVGGSMNYMRGGSVLRGAAFGAGAGFAGGASYSYGRDIEMGSFGSFSKGMGARWNQWRGY